MILLNLKENMPMIFDTQHRVPFCGKHFKKNNKVFQYEAAGFEMIEGKIESVIYFRDGVVQKFMKESEFFEKVNKNDLY